MNESDWLTTFLASPAAAGAADTSPSTSSLNWANLGLSTPVDTSTNTGASGGFFSSLINGISGIGSSALNAYKQYSGVNPSTPAPATSTMSATLKNYLPWILIGGGLLLVAFLFKRK